jgi:hypothetical protein
MANKYRRLSLNNTEDLVADNIGFLVEGQIFDLETVLSTKRDISDSYTKTEVDNLIGTGGGGGGGGTVTDGSITTSKIADNAVTSAKILNGTIATIDISDNAITTSKLSANAVTNATVADGALAQAKISGLATSLNGKVHTTDARLTDQRVPIDGSVSTAKLGTNVITNANVADAALAQAKIAGLATSLGGKVDTTDVRLSDQRVPTDGSVSTIKLADNAITSAKILDGTIATIDIADNAITSGKLASSLAVATALTVGGQAVVVNNDARLSDTRTPTDNTVTTLKIVDSAVTSAKLASSLAVATALTVGGQAVVVNNDARLADTRIPTDNTVTTVKIADGAVTTAKIADANVTSAKLASSLAVATALTVGGQAVVVNNDARLTDTRTPTDNTVTAAKIVDGAITSAKILDGTIATIDIADNAITTAKVINNAITSAKLATSLDIQTLAVLGTRANLPTTPGVYVGSGASANTYGVELVGDASSIISYDLNRAGVNRGMLRLNASNQLELLLDNAVVMRHSTTNDSLPNFRVIRATTADGGEVSCNVSNTAITPISYASYYMSANGVVGQVWVGLGQMVVGSNTNHPVNFFSNRFVNPMSMTIEANSNVTIHRPLTVSSTATFSGAATFNAGITASTGTITGNLTVNGQFTSRNPAFSVRVNNTLSGGAQAVASDALDNVIVKFAATNWLGPGTTLSTYYSTSTGRLTVPAGFAGRWQIHCSIKMVEGNGNRHTLQFLVNGFQAYEANGAFGVNGSTILTLAVGDYVEMGISHAIGSSKNIFQGNESQFVAQYLGSN